MVVGLQVNDDDDDDDDDDDYDDIYNNLFKIYSAISKIIFQYCTL